MVVYAGSVQNIALYGLDLVGLAVAEKSAWVGDRFYERIQQIALHHNSAPRSLVAPHLTGDVCHVTNTTLAYVVDDEVHQIDITDSSHTQLAVPRPGHPITGMHRHGHQIYLAYDDLQVLDSRDIDDLSNTVDCYSLDTAGFGLTVVGDSVVATCEPTTGMLSLFDPQDTKGSRFDLSVYGRPTSLGWDGSLLWYLDATTLQLKALQLPAQPTQNLSLKPD